MLRSELERPGWLVTNRRPASSSTTKTVLRRTTMDNPGDYLRDRYDDMEAVERLPPPDDHEEGIAYRVRSGWGPKTNLSIEFICLGSLDIDRSGWTYRYSLPNEDTQAFFPDYDTLEETCEAVEEIITEKLEARIIAQKSALEALPQESPDEHL
jgi:hypothetical protein